MQRRDALKTIIATTAIIGTSLEAYDEKLIMNKMDIQVQNPKNPTKHELKHLPEISVKDTDEKGFTLVEVTVGQNGIIHPSTQDHWIYEIELFADNHLISKLTMEPKITRGFLGARVDLKGIKSISAIARCNLHGNYTSEISL